MRWFLLLNSSQHLFVLEISKDLFLGCLSLSIQSLLSFNCIRLFLYLLISFLLNSFPLKIKNNLLFDPVEYWYSAMVCMKKYWSFCILVHILVNCLSYLELVLNKRFSYLTDLVLLFQLAHFLKISFSIVTFPPFNNKRMCKLCKNK